jgi:Mn2+/Fe2+ NRAMP family transporter
VAPVALLIGIMQLRLSYALIFRAFKLLTLALFAYIITAIIAHPSLLSTLKATVVPTIQFKKNFLGIVVAILGTTISPYLFFWQASSEVEEMKAAGARTEKERQGVTRRELKAARIDVAIGMLFSQLVMYAIILTVWASRAWVGTRLPNCSEDGAMHSAALANGRLASRWPRVKTDMAAIL